MFTFAKYLTFSDAYFKNKNNKKNSFNEKCSLLVLQLLFYKQKLYLFYIYNVRTNLNPFMYDMALI